MPKVLSQSLVSLADMYDVEGSIAGVDQLVSEEVSLVHEAGATMFSERLSSAIRRRATAAIAQNTNIGEVITDLPLEPSRILGIQVMNAGSTTVARVASLNVTLRDTGGREQMIWMWDGTVEVQQVVDDGAAVAAFEVLRPEPTFNLIPNFRVGAFAPQSVADLAMRGVTTGFGAGTVTLVLLVYLAFAADAAVSSFGLPIPSW